jgi:heme A synthase
VTLVCLLVAAQGLVGLIQYETQLPGELVWLHVALACGTWLAVLWSAAAAGGLVPHEHASSTAERTLPPRARATV